MFGSLYSHKKKNPNEQKREKRDSHAYICAHTLHFFNRKNPTKYVESVCMGDLKNRSHNEDLFISCCKCSIVKGRDT